MKKYNLKSLFAAICILAIVGTVIGTVAKAGDVVTATVTIGTVSVTVTPTTFDYGTMPFSSSKESFDTVGDLAGKNIQAAVGTLETDLDIKGAATTDWTTLHLTTAGVNTYVHKYSASALETTRPAAYVGLTTSFDDSVLAADVTASSSVWFGLEIYTPTSGVATQQSAAVTLRATWSE